MEEETKKKYRISNGAAFVLVILSILADLFTLIPGIGIAVGPIFWSLANFYFWKSGLGFVNSGRLATSAISAVAEVIPAIQELPTITVAMIGIILMTRAEDKTGISLSSMTKGPNLNTAGTRQPTPKQQPLNQGGTRAPGGGLV